MINAQYLDDLRRRIAQGELEGVLQTLLRRELPASIKESLKALSGRFHENEKQNIAGTLRFQEYSVEKNACRNGLIQLLNRMETQWETDNNPASESPEPPAVRTCRLSIETLYNWEFIISQNGEPHLISISSNYYRMQIKVDGEVIFQKINLFSYQSRMDCQFMLDDTPVSLSVLIHFNIWFATIKSIQIHIDNHLIYEHEKQ